MDKEKYLVLGTLSEDAFVMVNKKLAIKLGFVEAGLLGELISTFKYAEKNNAFFKDGEEGPWFYLKQDTIEERLGMKRKVQETAIKNLVKNEVIEKKLKGLPAQNYFIINWKKIVELFEEKDVEPASLSDCTNRTNKEERNVQTRKHERYIHTINKKEDIKNINKKEFVNKENDLQMENTIKDEILNKQEKILNHANEFYSEFANGRWDKKQWFTIVNKLAFEIIESGVEIKDYEAYTYGCLKQIAYKHDLKHGKAILSENFFNWLESEE
jgi:hypothetical protein